MSTVQTTCENESYTIGAGVEISTVEMENKTQTKSEFCIK